MPCSQEECIHRVVDEVPARLACYDNELRVLWINSYSASLLGKSPSELLGRKCCDVWQNCKQQCRKCHMTRALETGDSQVAEIDTPRGRIWSLTAFPQKNERGSIEFICEYGHDITADKKLKELEDEINAITRHDLKSPAISAVNTARLIQDDGNLTRDQRELLTELEKSGQHMLEIINQTLTLHKIEKGQYRAELHELDCVAVARDVRACFSGQQESGGCLIRLLVQGRDAVKDDTCLVMAEENLLRTALMNIVKNACEASPPGREVTIAICGQKRKTIAVGNAGAVPPEVRDDFFGKYVTFGKPGGTGLGTYSARKMVEAMNSRIAMNTSDEPGNEQTEIVITF